MLTRLLLRRRLAYGETKNGELSRMFGYAGKFHVLTVLGCVLSGISTILSMLPFVCIWLVIRDLIQAFAAGDISLATGSAHYAWMAVVFAAASILIYLSPWTVLIWRRFVQPPIWENLQFIISWRCRWGISAKMQADGSETSLMIMQGLQKDFWPISFPIWPEPQLCRLPLLF